jgi:PIN like domain
VRWIRELRLSPGWELTSVREEGHGGDHDVTWVTKFAREGGHAILSADKDFLKRHQQIVAICDAGLRVVHMPPKWANSIRSIQAAYMLFWWNKIEARLADSKARQFWKVPWGFADSPLILQKVDYEESRKRLKKTQRRCPVT